MSIEAMNWAYYQTTGSVTRKAVLVALANQADQSGRCWPSINYIAQRVECSTRTVVRVLDGLERDGFLSKQARPGDGSGRKSNVYQLHIDRPDDQKGKVTRCHIDGQSDTVSGGQSDIDDRQSDTVSPKQSINNQLKAKEAPVGALTTEQQKAEFWQTGVPLLTSQNKKMSEGEVRRFLGRVVKKSGFPDALEIMRLARHSGDAKTYLAAASFRVSLPEDNRSLWKIRADLGLPYEYDDLTACHEEIRKVLREKPELRKVVGA